MLRGLPLFTLALLACNGTGSATFPLGAELELSAEALALPEALRDGASVASLPCGPMGMCPTSAESPVSCVADVCEPAPQTVVVDLGVVDVDESARAFSSIFRSFESLEIEEMVARAERNTLNLDTEEIEVFWAPPGAVGLDEGAHRLAIFPAVAAGTAGDLEVTLDEAGSEALSAHFANVSRRFKLFARSTVDVDAGDPWPAGSLRLAVVITVTVAGRLL